MFGRVNDAKRNGREAKEAKVAKIAKEAKEVSNNNVSDMVEEFTYEEDTIEVVAQKKQPSGTYVMSKISRGITLAPKSRPDLLEFEDVESDDFKGTGSPDRNVKSIFQPNKNDFKNNVTVIKYQVSRRNTNNKTVLESKNSDEILLTDEPKFSVQQLNSAKPTKRCTSSTGAFAVPYSSSNEKIVSPSIGIDTSLSNNDDDVSVFEGEIDPALRKSIWTPTDKSPRKIKKLDILQPAPAKSASPQPQPPPRTIQKTRSRQFSTADVMSFDDADD